MVFFYNFSVICIMYSSLILIGASRVAQMAKNLPAVQEIPVQSLGQEGPLEKGTATHSSILTWRIPWTEETGWLHSMGSQRVEHDWLTEQQNNNNLDWLESLKLIVALILLNWCYTDILGKNSQFSQMNLNWIRLAAFQLYRIFIIVGKMIWLKNIVDVFQVIRMRLEVKGCKPMGPWWSDRPEGRCPQYCLS